MKTKIRSQRLKAWFVIIPLMLSFSLTITNAQLQPDTPLSEADASFIGEAAGDESGWTMPAGDVNGDGFDDILVNAWKNDEGGTDAGQTYLLLGSDTLGWGMDFDLSQADASFIGEA
ncbi:MAG: FG-GAP repeat protein, partial [Fidelibacterota bacterium]